MWFLLFGCAQAGSPDTPDAVAPETSVPAPPSPEPPRAPPLPAEAEARPPASVTAARAFLGRPYRFGGRGKTLDCMGLVFRAVSDGGRGAWRDLSVMPTTLVAEAQLGPVVIPGVPIAAVDWDTLRPGDVLYLLAPTENPAEPAIATVDGRPHWVWHMGLYSGGPERRFVVGDHYAGKVVESSLPAYLAVHADTYDALLTTRP
jgi:hypothetical protein